MKQPGMPSNTSKTEVQDPSSLTCPGPLISHFGASSLFQICCTVSMPVILRLLQSPTSIILIKLRADYICFSISGCSSFCTPGCAQGNVCEIFFDDRTMIFFVPKKEIQQAMKNEKFHMKLHFQKTDNTNEGSKDVSLACTRVQPPLKMQCLH